MEYNDNGTEYNIHTVLNIQLLLSNSMQKGALRTMKSDKNIELQVKGEIRARAKSLSKSFPVNFKERVQL